MRFRNSCVLCALGVLALCVDPAAAQGKKRGHNKPPKTHNVTKVKPERGGSTAPMRFRGLDRNGDGMISRTEWRGNDRSFAKADWNGDGTLSGDEVKPGAKRPDR